MAVTVKSEKQIALMREAGRLLAITHEELHKALKPGITTLDIDRLGEEIIRDFGCVPNFKNYNGFPASICVSINDEVVHGIPTDKRVLKEGDIVSLDAGLIYKGYHSDAARTWGVGEISAEAQRLIDIRLNALIICGQCESHILILVDILLHNRICLVQAHTGHIRSANGNMLRDNCTVLCCIIGILFCCNLLHRESKTYTAYDPKCRN